MSAPTAAPAPKSAATAKPAKTAKPKMSAAERQARKVAAFQRIAPPRVKRALDAIRRLDTIARSPGYSFTADQGTKIMSYIDEAVDRLRGSIVARVAGRKAGSEEISL